MIILMCELLQILKEYFFGEIRWIINVQLQLKSRFKKTCVHREKKWGTKIDPSSNCWKIWFYILYKTHSESNKHGSISFMIDNMHYVNFRI